MKKLLSVVLTLVLLFLIVPFGAVTVSADAASNTNGVTLMPTLVNENEAKENNINIEVNILDKYKLLLLTGNVWVK